MVFLRSLSLTKNKVNKVLFAGLLTTITTTNVLAVNNSFYINSGMSYYRMNVSKDIKSFDFEKENLAYFKPSEKDNVGLNFVIGKRFGVFGIEAGYGLIGKNTVKKTTTTNYSASAGTNQSTLIETAKYEDVNFNLDVNHYFNIIDNLELKSSIGLGVLQSKNQYNIYDHVKKKLIPEIKSSQAELKPRFGLGLQYGLTQSFSVDMTYQYQGGNSNYKDFGSLMGSVIYRL